ncbi:MAG: helix-turn-helix domain-containing protein [Oscillospiraceae bacterium]|nr:helix-turn-helix domain-containing protein [Oscillospiraceae bacterium]
MFDKKEMGKKIRELRNKRSQDEVAQALCISRGALSFYENGERTPDADVIFRMCEYFNVTSDFLLGLSSVKSYNTTLRGVCEYTGLSNISVMHIRNSKHINEKKHVALNHFFESSSFKEFSFYLHILDDIYVEYKSDKEKGICAESVINSCFSKDFDDAQKLLSDCGYRVINKAEAFSIFLQRAANEVREAFHNWSEEINNLYYSADWKDWNKFF